MTKIVYLDHAEALGGAEFSLLDLLRTLDRSRFEPTLACPPGPLAERARGLGVAVADLALEKLKDRNPVRSITHLLRGQGVLSTLVREGGFQIAHANTLRTAMVAASAGRRLPARFAWHVRDYVMPTWARSTILRRCHVAIAPSRFIARSLGASPKVRVVPNGIEMGSPPDPERAAAFRAHVGLPREAPVIGCLGRIRPWKGQRYFIDVAARLAARLPDARFLIVGATLFPDRGRDYVAELKELADSLGVADRVVFTGQTDEPLAALAAMDLLVHCSEDEPFGRVLIEAMASRRPVVAFRSGAVPEIVEDGSTGLLVDFADTTGMAEAIFDLLRNRTRAEAYGEAGRQRVADSFTVAASTRAIEAIYDELLLPGHTETPR